MMNQASTQCQNILRTGIRNVNRHIINREISVENLCNESLKVINATRNLNAFITICQDEAIQAAKQLDDQLSNDNAAGKGSTLYGLPISVKDSFCTNGILTTCGSKMLQNFVPPYSATVVEKLMKAKSLIMGKTNMDEFAMGSSSVSSHFGPSANIWKSNLGDDELPCETLSEKWFMAGGSSTGSAISVATGSCFASLGTDTGGSTRQPASLTGIVGFKPTYGLISRFGLVPLAHCLDVVSILARSVDDAEIMFDTLIGQDENDLTTVDHRKELIFKLTTDVSTEARISIGIPDKFIEEGEPSADVAARFDELVRVLSSVETKAGDKQFVIKRLSLENSRLATECYTIVSSAEIASNMSCYDGVKYGYSDTDYVKGALEFDRNEFFRRNRDGGFNSEVKKRILLGNYFLLAGNREKYLVQAQKVRRLIRDEYLRAFNENQVDIILMPSTPSTSVSYADWLKKQDNNRLFREDYYLIPANLANLPAISLPAGSTKSGLPVGIQLIADKFRDKDLLHVSKLVEDLVSTNNKPLHFAD